MGSISSWRVVAPRIRTSAFGTSSVERVCARTGGLITSTPQVVPLRFGITTALQSNPFLKIVKGVCALGIPKVMCDPEMSAPQVVPFSFGIIGALRATFYDLFFFLAWASSDMSLKRFEALNLTFAARGVWQYLRQLNISHMNNTH